MRRLRNLGLLFKRAASLVVSTSKPLLGQRVGRDLSNLRFSFEVTKNTESTPNQAKITVYNVSKETRSAIEEGQVLFLQAGYKGTENDPSAIETIFIGDIKRVSISRTGPDITTQIECGDGEKTLTESHFEQSFAPGTSASTVLSYLAAQLDVTIGQIASGSTHIFQNGLSLSGTVSKHLDLITKLMGLEWSIQDGELQIIKPNATVATYAPLVSKSTGLIGVPSKTKEGYEFTSLLNTKLRPGGPARLESEFIKGTFKVVRVVFNGDTKEGPWEARVEAKELKGTVA